MPMYVRQAVARSTDKLTGDTIRYGFVLSSPALLYATLFSEPYALKPSLHVLFGSIDISHNKPGNYSRKLP